MAIHIFLFIAGIVILYFSAHWLVSGASGLAFRLGVPSLVIGLTVVAFGTSSPELVVSISAAANKQGDIALGNVVGSNIVNIALILGLSALIRPLRTNVRTITSEAPIMIFTAVLLILVSLNSVIGRTDAVLFLIGIIAFTVFSYRKAEDESKRVSATVHEEFSHVVTPAMPILKTVGLVAIGIIGLSIGSHLLVSGAVEIAKLLEVSERFVGLTIVAAGTSVPELATSMVAAIRREADISVGNIVGSNIFNILAIVGLSSLISPIHIADGIVQSGYLWDYLIMVVLSVFLWVTMRTDMRITRVEGGIFLILYALYITWLIYRGS